MIHFRVRYERLRARLSRSRRRAVLLRAAWLAILVPLGALLLTVATDRDVGRVPVLTLAIVVFGAALSWLIASASRDDPGRMLDRRYGLDELIVTAVEVDRRGPRSMLEERLLDDAASAVVEVGRDRALDGHAARREAETLVALVLVLVGVWLVSSTARAPSLGQRLPPVSLSITGGPGPEPGGGDGPGRGPGPGPGGAGRSTGASASMQVVADALSDHAAAMSLAAALAGGDPGAAARAARSLADRANDLSDAGRTDLAATLHDAADEVSRSDPELAAALHGAGRALESPDPETAASGVERLATELDLMAAGGGADGGTEGARARTRTGPPASRLVVETDSRDLDLSDATESKRVGGSEGRASPDARLAPAGGVTGDAPSTGPVRAGNDRLQYPWHLRETVRRYFSRDAGGP